jgi:hypothetical protein
MAIPQEHELQPVDVHALTMALADMVKSEPSVLRMWVSRRRGAVSFWLLTPEIESDVERHLYRFSGDLQVRFPDALFHLHLINPRYYEWFDLDMLLPQGAQEIALRAA